MKHFKLRTDLTRFISKLNITNNCWLWTGTISPKGYGIFWSNRKNKLAHRISYQMFNGEIPKNKMVCHTCDIRECVNPDHLWVGTALDNNKDAIKKGRLKLVGKNNPFFKKRFNENIMIGAHKDGEKWRALVSKNGKTMSIGRFNTQLEAHKAYIGSTRNDSLLQELI